jgi:hypothetical protein
MHYLQVLAVARPAKRMNQVILMTIRKRKRRRIRKRMRRAKQEEIFSHLTVAKRMTHQLLEEMY